MNNEFDENYFNKVYSQYSKMIFSVAYHILFSEEEAMDIVQETFIRYGENMARLQNEKFWLIRVATNLCYDKHRKKKNWITYLANSTHKLKKPFLTISRMSQNSLEVEKMLAPLDTFERSLLSLRYGQDYNFNEIGEILGMSENTVKTKFFRLLAKMKVDYKED